MVRILQDRRFRKVQNANSGIKIQLYIPPQTFFQSPHEKIKCAFEYWMCDQKKKLNPDVMIFESGAFGIWKICSESYPTSGKLNYRNAFGQIFCFSWNVLIKQMVNIIK